VRVGQDHSRLVNVRMRDGTHFLTREPRLDDVIHVVKEQAPNAQEIYMVTE
jgi:hypothetical protein